MKTLEKLFGEGCSGAFHVGGRDVALLLMLALGLFASQDVSGASYTSLGNERVLLMNNWTKGRTKITNQGYYDTSSTAATYWTHTGPAHRTLAAGTNHVMRTREGTILWQLLNCRAGAAANIVGGNCVPTSEHSFPSGSGRSVVAATAAITMRNVLDAQVVSPYYVDGIGTAYFDVVNVYEKQDAEIPTVCLEIATNVLSGVETSFSDVTNPTELDWHAVPMTVLPVQNGRLTGDVFEGVEALKLEAPGGGGDRKSVV